MTSCRYWPSPVPEFRLPSSAPRFPSRHKARLIEYPLGGVVEQRQKRLGHDRAIEPEMNAGDRRRAQIRPGQRRQSTRRSTSLGMRPGASVAARRRRRRRRKSPKPSSSTTLSNRPSFKRISLTPASNSHLPAPLGNGFAAPFIEFRRGERTECQRDIRCDWRGTPSRKLRCRTARRCGPVLRRAR